MSANKKNCIVKLFESNRYWHGPNANDYSVGPGRVVSK